MDLIKRTILSYNNTHKLNLVLFPIYFSEKIMPRNINNHNINFKIISSLY
jgi:hypothetical protein